MKDIQYILAIAEKKSISKAAEALYTTQPSLSRHINGLEERLGLRLFERKSHGIELTPAGEIYVRYAKEIMRQYGQMEQELRAMSNGQMQRIRICMTLLPSFLNTTQIVEAFHEKFPNCDLDISGIRSVDIPEALHSRQYDIAVGADQRGVDSTLTGEAITEEYMLLLVPRHLDLNRYAVDRDGLPYLWLDLEKIPPVSCVLQAQTSSVRRHLNPLLEQYPEKFRITAEATNSSLAIHAAEKQQLCCLIPETFLPFVRHPANFMFYSVGRPPLYVEACITHTRDRVLTQQDRFAMTVIRKIVQKEAAEIRADYAGVQ